MKIQLAPAILAVIVLGGCASPTAPPTPPSPTEASVSPSPETASPATEESTAAAAEPASLGEALDTAKQEHTDYISAIGAMEDLYRQAQIRLEPSMTADAWNDIELIRIKTSLGALKDTLTEREVILGVRQFTTAMELEAIRQGKY